MTPSKTSRWMGVVVVVFYAFALDLISLIDAKNNNPYALLSWVVFSSLFFFVWDFIQPKSKSLPSRIGFVTLCSLLALITFFVMDYSQSPPIADHKMVVYLGAVFITLVMFILPSFLLGLLVVVLGWVIRKWFPKSAK